MDAKEYYGYVTEQLSHTDIPGDYVERKLAEIKEFIDSLPEDKRSAFYTVENANQAVSKIMSDHVEEAGDTEATRTVTKSVDSGKSKENEKTKTSTQSVPASMTVVGDDTPAQDSGKPLSGVYYKVFNSSNSDKVQSSIVFWTLFAILLPLILAVAVAAVSAFAGVYVLLAIGILALVCLTLLVVFGGSLLSLVTIVFGAVQFVTGQRVSGIHEIGLALIFIGATMIGGILCYNAAVRLIPFIYRLFGRLFHFITRKLNGLGKKLRKGCDTL